MTYRISGLDPAPFKTLFALSDEALAERGVVRLIVDERPGFPCRVSLDDAEPGQRVLLLNHVSHAAPNPYRASHAIFVTQASEAARFVDAIPPALERRHLSLRGFDADGMMTDALLTAPGDAEEGILRLFDDPGTAYIHAHNAARGCFAARVERT